MISFRTTTSLPFLRSTHPTNSRTFSFDPTLHSFRSLPTHIYIYSHTYIAAWFSFMIAHYMMLDLHILTEFVWVGSTKDWSHKLTPNRVFASGDHHIWRRKQPMRHKIKRRRHFIQQEAKQHISKFADQTSRPHSCGP